MGNTTGVQFDETLQCEWCGKMGVMMIKGQIPVPKLCEECDRKANARRLASLKRMMADLYKKDP